MFKFYSNSPGAASASSSTGLFGPGKRSREDGHLSRKEFEERERTAKDTLPGTFQPAPASTLSSRRFVVGRRFSKKDEFARKVRALNRQFTEFVNSQYNGATNKDWSAAIQDYLQYLSLLRQKYDPQNGAIFTFGSGECGQLGHGVDEDRDLMVRLPRAVSALNGKKICRVACGGLHSIALTSEGELYSWGCNDEGALGREMQDSSEENMPTLITGFPEGAVIVDIVAGDCHSAALTVSGDVYAWGCYKDKDGKPWFHADSPSATFKKIQKTPTLVPGVKDIADIKSGTCFLLARGHDGSLWSWGIGEQGQLGRPVDGEIKDKSTGDYYVDIVALQHLKPAKVEIKGVPVKDVKAIGCGGYHSIFSLAVGRKTYSTGINNYGQLGVSGLENTFTPVLISGLLGHTVTQISGGEHHSMVLTMEGKVFTFGRGDSGQLGIDMGRDPGAFKDSPQEVEFSFSMPGEKILSICCGSNHNLVLSSANNIYSWGFGEMFALGNGKERDEELPYRVNMEKTALKGKIIQIEAGGQHTAIVADGGQIFSSY